MRKRCGGSSTAVVAAWQQCSNAADSAAAAAAAGAASCRQRGIGGGTNNQQSTKCSNCSGDGNGDDDRTTMKMETKQWQHLSHPFTCTTLHTPLASKSTERFFSSLSIFPSSHGFFSLSVSPPSHGGVLAIPQHFLPLQIWPSSHKTHCWL